MKVEEQEIPPEALEKAAVWACTTIHFSLGELRGMLSRLRGVTVHAEEVAPRLLQKWKKEGKIMHRKGQWHWQRGK